MKKNVAVVLILAWALGLSALSVVGKVSMANAPAVEQYKVVERSFVSNSSWKNGFLEVDMNVTFSYVPNPEIHVVLPAFWDGKDAVGHDRFSVRFAPTLLGDWTYRTTSQQDPSLNGLTGSAGVSETIRSILSSSPGFLERTDTFHWRYSNGTRFFPVGTTAYEWVGTDCATGAPLDLVVDSVKKYFNKVRLSYMTARLADNAFGGRRQLSQQKENGYHWYTDLSQVDSRLINLEHWKKLDTIIRKLQQAGIQAELILARNNPLNQQVQGDWLRGVTVAGGRGSLIADKGLRYFVGRYAAFSNIWWCIGNEYPEAALTPEDITRIGAQIRKLDPYQHPLSVHWNESWLFGGQHWPSHGVLQTHIREHGLAGINANITQLRIWHGLGFSNDEYGYEDREGTPNTADTVLRAHWALVLGGGYGAYGHSPGRLLGKYMWAGLDKYWDAQGTPASPPKSAEQVAQGQVAAPWLGKMRDWLNSGKLGYWRMRPANHLVSGDAQNSFCLAAERSEYLVSGENGRLRLDLSAAAGNDLPVELFDPKTGEIRKVASTRGRSEYEYSVPHGSFMLLHVGTP
ncbi:MAG: DUF4038 domain-containing protein [Acidobacteria bacterium]|nr:DUF4038 domain-containing protein [Acidobacteriota bacterium]MCI0723910.1 DUF4038 domain-containing protein [Acidobacteriota bacterium]